jgi:hypothetical protein
MEADTLPYDPDSMLARLLLLAAAVALVAVGLQRHAAHDRCSDARLDTLAITLHRAPATGAADAARRIARNCRDVEEFVNGAAALVRVDAVGPAGDLARRAVAREPQRRDAWLALAQVRQRAGDASGSERALARARALDPVGLAPRGSLNRSSGRSTR